MAREAAQLLPDGEGDKCVKYEGGIEFDFSSCLLRCCLSGRQLHIPTNQWLLFPSALNHLKGTFVFISR